MWATPGRKNKKSGAGAHLASLGPDLYTLHRLDGFAVHVEPNSARVFQLPAEVLAGRGFLESVHILDRVGVAKAIEDSLSSGSSRKAQFRLAGMTPGTGATNRWFELRCEPAPEAIIEGEGVLVLAVSRDISERRALEDELRRQRQISDSANIAKSRFLANMSHELRTPLNAILGFSEVLQSEHMNNMPPERTREYIGLIHSSSNHLLNVLNGILDMSKIESGKYEVIPEPFDLSHAVRSSCEILRGQAEAKKIELVIHDMTPLPEVTADQRAVKQIMINLVSNAVKFTEEGGCVKIFAERCGRNIKLSVVDNGIGISPEHMDYLGQPFYQADSRYDRRYEGTGLGLSVVCGLVGLHHGTVKFDSRKGIGTTVTVTFPIIPPDTRPMPAFEHLELVQTNKRRNA
jgi:two-component system, cell cycle sensor histidine kinase DivJ